VGGGGGVRRARALCPPPTAIYVPPDEVHGYRNTGNGPLRFVCVVPHQE
jgi:oxalate decarboxylase/phosphoglucose isomerase-like protein (cupin superfamily)